MSAYFRLRLFWPPRTHAQTGRAGVSATGLKAANGAPVSFVYNPSKPEGGRYQITAPVRE